ncbi:PREDICTED: aquaporin-3-like [Nanorana parkeri]|uniref:aquaporin-3-like n=1 Tax=Nanorana parkeri TaxID=125878 RepID=UPI0008540541|nr:PREDICTED: aquaporin-3-like [Nanorana parkeri]
MDLYTLILKKLKMKLRTDNQYVRCGLAEFLGTLILILFGCGSVAQMELSGYAKAQFLSVNMAFGFAVTAGAYVCAGVSGAHLNPAVSLSMYLLQRMTCRMMLVYFLAQFLGAFIGAALVFALYIDALHAYSGGNWTVSSTQATAGIFASYPSEHLTILNGLTDQVIATAALMICILAVIDESNNAAPRGLQPFVIGLVVLLVGLSMGFNCGYPINPARDLAPRIFTAMAGWGLEVFRAGNHWWWVPVLGPMIGGVIGTLIYELLVGIHSRTLHEEDEPEEDVEENHPRQYELVQSNA